METIISTIWKTKIDRVFNNTPFKPVFKRYIGIKNSETEYNNILATILSKSKEYNNECVIFDRQISLEVDFDFINTIKNELSKIDLHTLSQQDITLFNNNEVNSVFLKAVEDVVNLARQQENFINKSVEINFICKMFMYAFVHISKLTYNHNKTNKCFYYGDINKHDVYFLMILYCFGFDVVYINPIKEEYFDIVDTWGLSEKVQYASISNILTFYDRAGQGNPINNVISNTVMLEQQIEQEMFTNSGIYRPWQFRDGNTVDMFLHSTIHDLEANWEAPAKVRQGFNVNNKDVYVPHLFVEIEGMYNNEKEYNKLYENVSEIETPILSLTQSQGNLYKNTKQGPVRVDLFNNMSTNENDKYSLAFTILNNGTFSIKDIQELPFYKYSAYNDDTERFMLNKINETILDTTLFANNIMNGKDDYVDFAYKMLSLNSEIIRLIDSFDFTSFIPKIVLFLEGEESLSKDNTLLLAYLYKIGFDVVVFSPAGLSNINTYINRNKFNTFRLDKMEYNKKVPIKGKHISSFFSRIFN